MPLCLYPFRWNWDQNQVSGLDAFVTVPFQCSWGQYQASGLDAFVIVPFQVELGSESGEWI